MRASEKKLKSLSHIMVRRSSISTQR